MDMHTGVYIEPKTKTLSKRHDLWASNLILSDHMAINSCYAVKTTVLLS